MEDEGVILKGLVERIGSSESTMSYTISNREKRKSFQPIENHSIGIKLILEIVENWHLHIILPMQGELKYAWS